MQSARLAGGNAGSKRFTMCAAGVAAPSPAVCRPSRGGAGAFSSTASVCGSGGRRALHAVGGNGASVAPAPAAAAAPAGYGGQEEGWYIYLLYFS